MQNLDLVLGRLERADLVRQATEPELAYIFKHTLTQETSYQSLLVKRRRDIHRRVAECYEKLYADRLDEYAALLAGHYAEAGDGAKTLAYSERAGDAAARVFANAEAIAHYTRALEIAERAGGPVTRLYRARGQVYDTLGDFERARTDFENALRAAQTTHDGTAEWQSLIDLGFLWLGRNYARSGKFLRQADELAQGLGDQKLHAHS